MIFWSSYAKNIVNVQLLKKKFVKRSKRFHWKIFKQLCKKPLSWPRIQLKGSNNRIMHMRKLICAHRKLKTLMKIWFLQSLSYSNKLLYMLMQLTSRIDNNLCNFKCTFLVAWLGLAIAWVAIEPLNLIV